MLLDRLTFIVRERNISELYLSLNNVRDYWVLYVFDRLIHQHQVKQQLHIAPFHSNLLPELTKPRERLDKLLDVQLKDDKITYGEQTLLYAVKSQQERCRHAEHDHKSLRYQ